MGSGQFTMFTINSVMQSIPQTWTLWIAWRASHAELICYCTRHQVEQVCWKQ